MPDYLLVHAVIQIQGRISMSLGIVRAHVSNLLLSMDICWNMALHSCCLWKRNVEMFLTLTTAADLPTHACDCCCENESPKKSLDFKKTLFI